MESDRITNKRVAVGVDRVVIAEELLPKQRKEIFICNTSVGGQKISLGFSQDAVVGTGVVLSPGGSFSSSADGSGFSPISSNISAISDLAGGTLAIMERVGRQE
jgi:hypothetical protein